MHPLRLASHGTAELCSPPDCMLSWRRPNLPHSLIKGSLSPRKGTNWVITGGMTHMLLQMLLHQMEIHVHFQWKIQWRDIFFHFAVSLILSYFNSFYLTSPCHKGKSDCNSNSNAHLFHLWWFTQNPDGTAVILAGFFASNGLSFILGMTVKSYFCTESVEFFSFFFKLLYQSQ